LVQSCEEGKESNRNKIKFGFFYCLIHPSTPPAFILIGRLKQLVITANSSLNLTKPDIKLIKIDAPRQQILSRGRNNIQALLLQMMVKGLTEPPRQDKPSRFEIRK
jgi:hypothetical protein